MKRSRAIRLLGRGSGLFFKNIEIIIFIMSIGIESGLGEFWIDFIEGQEEVIKWFFEKI